MAVATGYEAEIRKIEQDIADVGGPAALEPPTDSGLITQYVGGLYQRASIAGDLAALGEVEHAIERAIPLLPHPGDLFLLKANAAFKLHRLDDTEKGLRAIPSVYGSAAGRLIRADLDFQRGQYRRAREGYCEVIEAERSWAALVRLAYLTGKMGDPVGADRLYQEAQDELTAKELRAYAWIEVQRGFLDFVHGRDAAARSHYQQADKAYPGYWLTDEHIAELLAAEGRYAAAIEILERLASSGGRPDLEQAIGELYRLAGEVEHAQQWLEKALATYLQSAGSGAVHFWHHLADYYTEVARDGARAVAWAQKDLQLRQNFATAAALAAALSCSHRIDEARDWIDRALASGVVDARLFLQAGRIHLAAGDIADGQAYLERATSLNSLVDRFHLHH
jgi:tetratricopeptide (TPR) repeat protein